LAFKYYNIEFIEYLNNLTDITIKDPSKKSILEKVVISDNPGSIEFMIKLLSLRSEWKEEVIKCLALGISSKAKEYWLQRYLDTSFTLVKNILKGTGLKKLSFFNPKIVGQAKTTTMLIEKIISRHTGKDL
jgi:hypothetical protein